MAKISFSTKPQKAYYSYVSDGHIYDITTKKPEVTADEGGCWCCYFECEPYHKYTVTIPKAGGNETVTKTALLYEKVGTDYVPTNSSYFNTGNNEYWYEQEDAVGAKTWTKHTGKYYPMNGKGDGYNMPNEAKELPQIKYPTTNGEVYYLDKLIKNGATYDKTNKKFVPMDVTSGSGATTYGDILLKMVEDSISVSAFVNGVNDLPEYLTGNNLSTEYKVTSIGYTVPANYLIVYGGLFVKKLNEKMKALGDSFISKYVDTKIETQFKKCTITTSVTDATYVGTLTTTPSAS